MDRISRTQGNLAASARARATKVHLTLSAFFLTLVMLWSAGIRHPLAFVSALAVVAVLGVIPVFTRSCRRRCRPGVLVVGYAGIPVAWGLSVAAAVSLPSPSDSSAATVHAALLLACPIGYWLFLTLALRRDTLRPKATGVETLTDAWASAGAAQVAAQPLSTVARGYAPSSRAAISRSKSLAPSKSLYTEANRR